MSMSDNAPRSFDLLLPPVIPAVVGHEINLYFDNLIGGEATRYDFDIRGSIGRHRNDRWTCVPEEAGDYPLAVEVYSEDGEKLAEAETVVRVKAAGAGGMDRRVLFVGDSTTAAGIYTGELLRLFSADYSGVTLLGTKGSGRNAFEGRGGWRVIDYYEKEDSPFVFEGKFDFSSYMAETGYEGVDDVCIHLGINDIFHASEENGMGELLGRAMPMLENMIADIRRFNAAVRIGIMLIIPPSRTQDSFGRSYGVLQSRRRYKRKWFLWNRELLHRFSGRDGIDIIPLHVNIDTARNMPSELTAGNARNGRMELSQSNGVHPAPEGYRQMADVLYAWLKA
ncbi:SGNH/GDSL hydrolase family protein [Paenibacillus hodogayensis]|uniref:SGNH/GDSL hydrolase family protein n=1 Tax=Paenibacillus hodogayensis TaxID=279208 RepID=A0ABV5VTZ7_9BACL